MTTEPEPGFYWARIFGNRDLVEVVRRESGMWWACGNEFSLSDHDVEVIARVEPPKELLR